MSEHQTQLDRMEAKLDKACSWIDQKKDLVDDLKRDVYVGNGKPGIKQLVQAHEARLNGVWQKRIWPAIAASTIAAVIMLVVTFVANLWKSN
jgi:hypothetical protein